MRLALREVIARSGNSSLDFFRCAYWWKFQKEVDLYRDDFDYRTKGKIPQYVVDYIKHLEGRHHGL